MSASRTDLFGDGAPHLTLRIKRAQRLYATVVLVVPALGVVVAGVDAVRGHVHPWQLILLAAGYAVTMLGITVGFHRLLSHAAFKTSPAVRAAFAIAGSMAAQGPPLYWVCTHRVHHQSSDREGDPHSPHVRGGEELGGLVGFWHAHAEWTLDHPIANPMSLARDLMRDPWLRWVNQRYIAWVAAGILAPAVIGAVVAGDARGAWEGLLWGGLVRLFLTFHLTWSINSFTHLFGYRSFATRDRSRNNAWLALPTFGEAWHNNHHAFPSSAWLGLRFWEIDLGAWLIRALGRCGLAWEIVQPTEGAQRRLRLGHGGESEGRAGGGGAGADGHRSDSSP